MKLYLVTREDYNDDDYYSYDSFIIACKNEEEARETHPSYNERKEIWSHDWIAYDQINKLNVKYLSEAGPDLEKGVILASFNAGE